jgi:hypothetical protein
MTPAVVVRAKGLHRDRSHAAALSLFQLHDPPRAGPAQQRLAATRRHHGGAAGDHPQRRQVQVVGMRVRDQHGVERHQAVHRGQGGVPADVGDPCPEDRISEDPHPVELHQDRRMADVGEPAGGRHVSALTAGAAASTTSTFHPALATATSLAQEPVSPASIPPARGPQ